MQRTIHTFRASTMDDAMDLVRRELGPDAIVVESKEITKRRLLPWTSTQPEIEIRAERMVNRQDLGQLTSSNQTRTSTPRIIRTLAETQSSTSVTRELFSSIPDFPSEFSRNECVSHVPTSWQPRKMMPSTQSADSKGRRKGPSEEPAPTYQRSLESLQSIVTQLERQSRSRGMSEIPGELFQPYLKLITADVEEQVARDMIATLRQHLTNETLNSPAAVTAMQTVLIEREMRCAPPLQLMRGRREIVTLVGPTGVGKTTTIAKIAGDCQLRKGLRVGLITVDTYRVGAVEQLMTYADILQIPLRTASNPDELRTAIDELDDVDLILIDTAGRSPLDHSKLNELRDIVQVTTSDHVLLVLSLAAGPKMISKIADQFASAKPTSLVLTKLDEVPGHGGLMSVARDVSYPVSYIATGQDVPDDIEPAHPNRLARLVLGLDTIHQKPD